jgi:pantoate--beta-alanine ligase
VLQSQLTCSPLTTDLARYNYSMTECLLGLGSNLGDRVSHLIAAVSELRRCPAIEVKRVSSFVESAAVGGPAGQRRYFNAAAVIVTGLAPDELVAALLDMEKKLGRVRGESWGPRTIDLDVLLYGEAVIESPQVSIPHPRLHERRFVLAPAAEIAADWRHPVLGQTIGQLLSKLAPESRGELGIRVIRSPPTMHSTVLNLQREGRRIGLVPTMGALHAGHLSLLESARQRTDVVIATIFVNPTQFGPQEDLSTYPRTLDADLDALSAAGCDLVFVPAPEAIYPSGFSTFVEPPAVAQPLEGMCRPGHFRGVATVVLKLFHLIPADVACFGQKDYQQLQVIRRMAIDLDLPLEIVSCPTVREADGLAMSSRNRYLSPAERQQALALSRSLERADELVAGGERSAAAIVAAVRRILVEAGISRIDYVAIAETETLAEKSIVDGPVVVLIAAHVGATRLIDNRVLWIP